MGQDADGTAGGVSGKPFLHRFTGARGELYGELFFFTVDER